MSLEIYRYLAPVWVITISGFEHDCDAILVIWRRHVPQSTWCHFSFHWVYGHL